jgi:phosphopantothenoylcysteine decarboxylase/phosphopantothenate--cysteine ligase
MKKRTIVLGITGSIAAYKAADLTSKLTKAGHDVFVVLSKGAQEFITPLTLRTLSRHAVTTNLFDEGEADRPTHIELADSADILVIAPASANLIAKLAHGFADDALTAIALATRAPMLVAPAMNGKMYLHPATQKNIQTLRERGVEFIGPDRGMQACGYEGLGRLWDVEGIAARIDAILNAKQKKK